MFSAQSSKNLGKTKKTKKNKTTRRNGYIGLNFLVSLFFLESSRGFCYFGHKTKKPRDNQRNNTASQQTLLELWVCNLGVLLCLSRVFHVAYKKNLARNGNVFFLERIIYFQKSVLERSLL